MVVLVVLVLATAFGLWRARCQGAVRATPDAPDDDVPVLGRERLGHDLGARATLVQFSTAFCQPCRAARTALSHVAASAEGVEHVEVDAESNLDLVRELGIFRTPTTLILDTSGCVIGRASGVPRLDEVRAALPAPPS